MDKLVLPPEPFLTDPNQIKAWLVSVGVWQKCSINADGLVDVKGDVRLEGTREPRGNSIRPMKCWEPSRKLGPLGNLKRLPVRFGSVSGDFICHHNQLATLEGAPKEVGGNFDCSYNLLVNLEGAPEKVGGYFYCGFNQVASLEGGPKELGWNFICNNNQLVSLEGAPKKLGGHFICSHNQLVSLEGAPKEAGWNFICNNNQLVSLEGAPKEVGGHFICSHNQLASLEGAPKEVGGCFECEANLLVDFIGMEGTSIAGDLIVTAPRFSQNDNANVFVSLEGLPKELYGKVKGYDARGEPAVAAIQALIAAESQLSGIPDIEI